MVLEWLSGLGLNPLEIPSLRHTVLLKPVGGASGLMNLSMIACLGGLWEPGMGSQQISDLWFALILHLDTDSEEQTLPFPVPSERLPLRRMSPFSSTLNLQPSFPGRSYFDYRSSPHQLSLHSSLQSLNAPGELSCQIFLFISVSWRHL